MGCWIVVMHLQVALFYFCWWLNCNLPLLSIRCTLFVSRDVLKKPFRPLCVASCRQVWFEMNQLDRTPWDRQYLLDFDHPVCVDCEETFLSTPPSCSQSWTHTAVAVRICSVAQTPLTPLHTTLRENWSRHAINLDPFLSGGLIKMKSLFPKISVHHCSINVNNFVLFPASDFGNNSSVFGH